MLPAQIALLQHVCPCLHAIHIRTQSPSGAAHAPPVFIPPQSDPHLLTFVTYVIAELEYRRMDELLVVLVRVNDIVRRRADEVLDWFQKLQGAARASKVGSLLLLLQPTLPF